MIKNLTKIFLIFCFFCLFEFSGCRGASPFKEDIKCLNESQNKFSIKSEEKIEKTLIKVEKALLKLEINIIKKEEIKNKVYIETKNFKVILQESNEETDIDIKPKILGDKKEIYLFNKEIEKQINSIIYTP